MTIPMSLQFSAIYNQKSLQINWNNNINQALWQYLMLYRFFLLYEKNLSNLR